MRQYKLLWHPQLSHTKIPVRVRWWHRENRLVATNYEARRYYDALELTSALHQIEGE